MIETSRDPRAHLFDELEQIATDWMDADDSRRYLRDDPYGEILALSLATYVDGVPITPLGYDVSHRLGGELA